ncbi:hypothetical protein [Chitinimonas lacunae]|uniref:Uncharacterized protein n=1 Tax=Chitinimonas lacunae TaxID=1963018 RepID=A0ABV8MYX1_9NEIS
MKTAHNATSAPWENRDLYQHLDSADAYRKFIDFLLDAIVFIEDDCPPVAQRALATARDYWNNSATEAQLTQARVECIRYLQAKDEMRNPQKKEFQRVRAVLFLLYAEPRSDDIAELAQWFVMFMKNCGSSVSQLGKMFEVAFSN